ncbi:MAG: type II toxin-antitoxin system VapC family toxin [Acidobacteriota bacterium]
MSRQLLYLDSSALIKLVVREPETTALFALLKDWSERISSSLARVEVLRSLRRIGAHSSTRRRAEQVLARIALIAIDDDIVAAASALEPADLRTLDAIHLGTALSVRGDLAALVTYDLRLALAAARAGLQVWRPVGDR